MYVTHVEGPTVFWGLSTSPSEVEITSKLECDLQDALNKNRNQVSDQP